MYSIPFNTAKKIIYSIDEVVNNNEEDIIEELSKLIEDNNESDSYNNWSPGFWMKISNFLGEKGKLKELIL